MSRSSWKITFSTLKPKIKDARTALEKHINLTHIPSIWSRSSTVLPEDIGKTFKIHNGKGTLSRKVVEEMVGHKFGELAVTKKKVLHKIKKIRYTPKKK